MMKPTAKVTISEIRPVSDRIITLRNANPSVQVYMSTTRSDEDELREIYAELQRTVDEIPKRIPKRSLKGLSKILLEIIHRRWQHYLALAGKVKCDATLTLTL